MNVLITGARGLIGSELVSFLRSQGHRPVPLVREGRASSRALPSWNPEQGQIHLGDASGWDAVIHLAGETIARRWTPERKARIRASRVNGTRLLCEALTRLPSPPNVLICASATGFFGHRGDELLDERSGPGSGFLAEVCQAWEAASQGAADAGIRVVNLRLGIVLTPRGGALASMLPAFRCGLGGRFGTGQQYWSWIAMDDLQAAVGHALSNTALAGPVNAVAPAAVTNAEFSRTLGKILRRPTPFSIPAVVARVLFGEMADETLLASTRVRPARLLDAGFEFHFAQLDQALRHLLGTTSRSC